MTQAQAQQIADYLIAKNLGFCFTQYHGLISREYLADEYGIKFE